jgi:hypothetical protein
MGGASPPHLEGERVLFRRCNVAASRRNAVVHIVWRYELTARLPLRNPIALSRTYPVDDAPDRFAADLFAAVKVAVRDLPCLSFPSIPVRQVLPR